MLKGLEGMTYLLVLRSIYLLTLDCQALKLLDVSGDIRQVLETSKPVSQVTGPLCHVKETDRCGYSKRGLTFIRCSKNNNNMFRFLINKCMVTMYLVVIQGNARIVRFPSASMIVRLSCEVCNAACQLRLCWFPADVKMLMFPVVLRFSFLILK